jgi:DNA-binding SARP family transcriptional activator/predicted ATPase
MTDIGEGALGRPGPVPGWSLLRLASAGMWLGVLGPVECAVGETAVEVSARLNRALLAALAVDRDRVTGIDELVDAMWGDEPPAAAEKVVRNRVSQLRALLTPPFIETVGVGYRLGSSVSVDTDAFEDVRQAGADRLALWRGMPFGEIAEWPPARAAAVRLGEMRAHLEEVAVAEQLDAGVDASGLVGGVESLVEAEPFRERRWALLMRTLYLAGRQHEALQAFQRARVLLRDELGLSPGAELLDVERSILNQEPSLRPTRAADRAVRPPRSADHQTSRLVGRGDDVEAVGGLLDEQRLVTVAGLGGVGKTSLARARATGWHDHHVVDLTSIDDAARVDETVARTLRIAATPNPRESIAAWSSTAPSCLLVLDNCEHVREAATGLADTVLGSGSGPTVLATSRVPLGHPDEAVYHLRPLARADAITLFRTRSERRHTTSRSDDDAVDQLCQVLSDVPLALELAAARATILSPTDMIRDLTAVTATTLRTARTRRSEPGGSGVLDVVAWAVRALSPDAALLFRRCAIFPGGFTMGAARVVVGGDLIGPALTDAFAEIAEASLIDVRFDAGTRYHYLDLVRQRADQLLDEAGERSLCEQRMVRWAVIETDGITYLDLDRLLAELPNLTAAAELACAQADVDAALRITGASFVVFLAQRAELIDSKLTAVQLPGAEQYDRFARSCGELVLPLLFLRADIPRARQFAELLLRDHPDSRSAGWAHFVLGHIEGNLERERRALALAHSWHDPLLQLYASSVLIDNLGQGGADDAWDLVRDDDRVAAEIDEPWARVMSILVRGMAYCQVDPDAALVHLERGAEMADRYGFTAYAGTARALTGLAGNTADPRTRLELTRRSLIDADRAGVPWIAVIALGRLARTLLEMGRPDRAAIFAGAGYARFGSTTERGTRAYQIDREDYRAHLTMYDLGATMDIDELVALIDDCLAGLDDQPA